MFRPGMVMPSFECKDIGMACSFETEAKTQNEFMKQIDEHSLNHGCPRVPCVCFGPIHGN